MLAVCSNLFGNVSLSTTTTRKAPFSRPTPLVLESIDLALYLAASEMASLIGACSAFVASCATGSRGPCIVRTSARIAFSASSPNSLS